MSLLAGPRRKQKLGFDPNNTNWAKDTSAIGQSLLKKMGWKEGAGLGANEDGIVIPIKASMKSDSRGLGCTAQQADAWIAHQEEFDKILASLNGTAEKEGSSNVSSQEESNSDTKENQEEGQRRFYGRFSRGGVKQLRTTDDLDCILGRRKDSKKAKTEKKEKNKEADSEANGIEPTDEENDKKHGFTTVTSTCSVQDYFAQKMKNKNLPPSLQKKSEEESTPESNEEEQTLRRETFSSGGCTVQDYFAQKMRAKKAKLAVAATEEDTVIRCEMSVEVCERVSSNKVDGDGGVCDNPEIETNKRSKKKKKKAKSVRSETQEESDVSCNIGIEICNEETTEKTKDDDTASEEMDSNLNKKSKKKKKKRMSKSACAESDNVINLSSDVEIVDLVPTKVKNNKKQKAVGVENVINLSSDEEVVELPAKEKKSKKRQAEVDNVVNLSFDVEVIEPPLKKEKKSKKRQAEDVDNVVNLSFDVEVIEPPSKKEKKSKKRQAEVDNIMNLSSDVEVVEVPSKKQKKRRNATNTEAEDMEAVGDVSIDKDGGNKKLKLDDKQNCNDATLISLESENEEDQKSNKNKDKSKCKNDHLNRMQRHILREKTKTVSVNDVMKDINKDVVMRELKQLCDFSNDTFYDEMKSLQQADRFQQLTKDLRSNLKAKVIKKQSLEEKDEKNELKVEKLVTQIQKLKESAVTEAGNAIGELRAAVEASGTKTVKKLRTKRKHNHHRLTTELAEKLVDECVVEKQVEVLKASYKASNFDVWKCVRETKQCLDKMLDEFVKDIEGLEDVLASDVKRLDNIISLKGLELPTKPSCMFPGAVEVNGY